MIIKAELAQHIVDNIMPLVCRNINIMDNSGLIIGSGQKERLNTYHQGAIDVIQSSTEIEIFPEDLERFPGAIPGLNWPIVLGNQIVGVVGVSGHPDLVRNTTKIVKMVTELLLERESLAEEYRANLQLREQFLQLLIADHYQDNYMQITKIAKLLRFDLTLPRVVAIIPTGSILQAALNQYGAHDLVTTRTRETITQLLKSSTVIDYKDLFVFTEDELIILKHFPTSTPVTEFCQWGSDILKIIDCDHRYSGLCIGLGSFTSTASELRESHKEAMFSQKSSTADINVVSIYEFDTLVSYLLSEPGALHSCLALRKLKEIIQNKLDFKYDMPNTVTTLLANNLNVSSTAKALFIHRNTLVFRLEKLKELTGLAPNQSLNHAMLCKILFCQ